MSTDKTINGAPRVDAPRRKTPTGPVTPVAPAAPAVEADRIRVQQGLAKAPDPLTQVKERRTADFLADPAFDDKAGAAATRQGWIDAQLDATGLKGAARERKAKILGMVYDRADKDGSGRIDATEATGLTAGLEREQRVAQVKGMIEKQAATMADAVGQAEKAAKSGNFVARSFNSFVDIFNHNLRDMESAANNAVRTFKSELPADLERYHEMVASAGDDPGKLAAADEFLSGALEKSKRAGQAFDKQAAEFKQGSKFWAGLAADVSAGLMVLGGVALCITGFGAPIGAGLIAGGVVAGGAATVGMHALLDNQYDFKKEALGNFVVGGISAGATVLTAGAGAGATQAIGRMAVRQGVIGGSTSLAGAAANEASNGWQDGWALRMFTATAVGAGTGAALGAGSSAIAQKLIPQGLSATAQRAVNVGLGSATGAVGAGSGAVINEGIGGFQEGWQDRVLQQILGGGLSGAAYAFGPDLAARNQALLARRASPRGQAVQALRDNFEDLGKLGVRPEILEKGVSAVSGKTRRALEKALDSQHGSIDAKGAANVEHLATVFGGVLERAYKQNGGKPLTQTQVDRLAMETVLTDAWAKGNAAKDLERFRSAPTNAGDTAGEIFAHLKAEAKKAIAAPKGSELERVIHDRIEAGKLNPGIVADPEFQAALKASNFTDGQTRALMTRINKNFLNVTPAMLGTWVHGVPSFDAVSEVVIKAGGNRATAQQVYESVLGHHMSGFIANGFARGHLELDFPAMVRQGHLSPEQATRLGNLYSSATALAAKWRPIVDKITQKGQTITGPDGQKVTIHTLTPRQRAAYEKAAEPYRQAIAELPEAVRSQLVNDDQRQFTAQGLPKWLGMMQGMKQPKTNGQLIDIVYREPLQAYLLENVARGSHEPFIQYSSQAAGKLGMVFDTETMAYRPAGDPSARTDMARRIQGDAVLGPALKADAAAGKLPANATPAQVVDWFMARPAAPDQVMRLVNAP